MTGWSSSTSSFALFATFERSLRDHLSASLEPVVKHHGSSTGVNLHEFLEGGVDNWRIDSVIELYHPPAIDQDVNNAKAFEPIVTMSRMAPPPVSIPQTVYSQLSDFLRNAGLVS